MVPGARFAEIERKRSALLDEIDAMPSELLTGRLRPGKWSVLEIIEHLVRAEEDVFIDFAGLDALDTRRRTLKDRVLYLVVMFVLRFDIPVPAPSRAMLPEGGVPLTELRQRWEENHRRLRRYVEGLDRAASKRAVFRHPVAGPMTVPQALRMLEVHLDRHVRQIRSLERLYRDRSSAGSGPRTP